MNIANAQATGQRLLSQLNLTLTITPVVAKGQAAATPVLVMGMSSSARRNDDRFSPDAKVRDRQRLLTIAGIDVNDAPFADPKADDIIAGFEGSNWRVLGNSPFRPDGVTAVYHETVVQR